MWTWIEIVLLLWTLGAIGVCGFLYAAARKEKWRVVRGEITYELARHIRNTDSIPALPWGVEGLGLLAKLRGMDPETYDREVKGPNQRQHTPTPPGGREQQMMGLLNDTADEISSLLDQLELGHWQDDVGHEVKFNQAILKLGVVRDRIEMLWAEVGAGLPPFPQKD